MTVTERNKTEGAYKPSAPEVRYVEIVFAPKESHQWQFRSSVHWTVPRAFQSVRFELLGKQWGRSFPRWKIDCAKPVDPFPAGLNQADRFAIRHHIIVAFQNKYPDSVLSEFSVDKIDLETPVYERAAVKEQA